MTKSPNPPTGESRTAKRIFQALLLFLLLSPQSVGFPSKDSLAGRWAGGVSYPANFTSVVLDFEAGGGDWNATYRLPGQGRGGWLRSRYELPRIKLEAFSADGSLNISLDLTLENEVLRGTATPGGSSQSFPVTLLRIHPLAAETTDGYLGDYRTPEGERIVIRRRSSADPDQTLLCTWASDGRSRVLFPVSESEFVAGPSEERPYPISDRISFSTGATKTSSHLRWEKIGTGVAVRAPRSRLSFDSTNRDRFANFIETTRETLDVASASVGIVSGNTLAWAESFGVRNRESRDPAHPEKTLYQIASATKPLTATLLLALRDEGMLDLDDPITDYLPRKVALPPTGLSGTPTITLRQLLTHTSGLPLQPINYVYKNRQVQKYSVKELYAGLPHTNLLFPAGTSWSYSNLGYILLSHVIAKVGGASFEELLRTRIFEPLRMEDSTINLTPEEEKRLATHYWSDDPFRAADAWRPGEISGHGGVSSTVRDLAKWVSLQFRTQWVDPGPLRASTLREIHRRQRSRGVRDGEIGYGWFIDRRNRSGEVLSHSGFTGGNSSYVAFSPEFQVGVIVLVNSGFAPAVRIGEWMIDEAVELARSQRSPTRNEALSLYTQGDSRNALWALQKLPSSGSDGEVQYALARLFWESSRPTEARTAWEKAARLGFATGSARYHAALASLRERETKRALQLLRGAVAAGYDRSDRYASDPDLRDLRDHEEFRQLLASLRKRESGLDLEAEALNRYVGSYRLEGLGVEVRMFLENGALMSQLPGQGPQKMRALGDHRFKVDSLTVTFRIENDRAVALRAASGGNVRRGVRVGN